MKDLYTVFKKLARRYHSRWSAIDDALALVRSTSGAHTTEGERTRRMLVNAFRVQNYPEKSRERCEVDRANAVRKLGKPLSEALGHILTIELADDMLSALDVAERERRHETYRAEDVEKGDSVYADIIACLNRHGVVRGDHEALSEENWNVVARFIRRKVEQKTQHIAPIRTDRETRSDHGRLHPFWNAYPLPDEEKFGR